MQNVYKIILLFFCVMSFSALKAQSALNPDSVIYRKSWEAGFRLRSDGFGLGAEFTRAKRFKRSLLFQVQFAYFRHPKQVRQQSPFGGGGLFGSDGFKPYVYGKQNTLFTLYAGVGQKFLLAEKGKRHGVQIFFKYAGGFSLGILKPYLLEVVDTSSITGNTFANTVTLGYEPNNPNSLFLDHDLIAGAAGFGKGWKLKILPALHAEIGMEFDWAKNESFIKALEIGVAADFYFKKVPVMVQNNKFLYPSVYAGFMLGRRKER
ncbi:MAG: hypothetical protein JWN78_3243 [Bacteroidota bacterium]|nr:hypothetical protein [Bacteroidota bacterium]